MGYELDMEDYHKEWDSMPKYADYQTTLKFEWKISQLLNRAEQIAHETRVKMGEEHECYGFDIQCDCETPEFQKELHPAHCFNKYLMEQRIIYGGKEQ